MFLKIHFNTLDYVINVPHNYSVTVWYSSGYYTSINTNMRINNIAHIRVRFIGKSIGSRYIAVMMICDSSLKVIDTL